MKKILFSILISSYLLVADALPTSIKSAIKSVSNTSITLASNIPKGMSGIVVHNYGNGLSAITHTLVSQGGASARVGAYRATLHKNIPSIKTPVTVGDKVIFGNFYNNVLLIAPNQTAYKQITKKFQRTWVHPDAFALYFMQEGETSISMNNLESFSRKNQVGLVLVVTEDALLVIDPISKSVIGRTALKTNPNTAMTPFYARFEQMDVSVFGMSEKNFTPYFKSVAGLK